MKLGIFKTVGDFIIKKSPTILTALAVSGVVGTAVMTARATIIASEDYHNRPEEEKARRKSEFVSDYWRHFVPPIIMGSGTIACIIAGHSISTRRNLALASAYTLAERSLSEYQKEVREVIGEKKEQAIRDNLDRKRIEANPPGQNEIIITGKGETLCFDQYSGRYFKSDIDKIRKIESNLNKRLMVEMFLSLNEFYYEVGLSPIPLGNDFGWNINEEGPIDIHYSAQLTDDDTPCLVLSYTIGPRFNLGDY